VVVMEISEFQRLMRNKLSDKDRQMGSAFLMNVLMEEVGELSRAIRKKTRTRVAEEIADVIFSTISIANLFDIQIEPILKRKYIDRPLSEISQRWTDVTWR